MSDPKTPGDAILEFVKNSNGGVDSVKTLLGDIATITAGHMQAAESAGVDTLTLSPLQEALKRTADMQSLVRELEAAQTAGDWENAEALTKQIVDISGMPSSEPDVYEPQYEDLMAAIEDDDLDAMRRVLEAEKPDLNVPLGAYETTPLLRVLGAENRSVEKVMLLIEHGAKVDAASVDGYGALHAIADYMWRHDYDATTDEALAKLLVSHGADLETRDEYRLTPLLRAINCGNSTEVAALLAAGADPNVASPDDALPECHAGQTALMAAAAKPEEVQLLLGYGAKANARSSSGLTVLEVIDAQLQGEADSDYPEYYVKLRESRELIEDAARAN